MEKHFESIYADTDKDAEREKEEKEMFRDSIKYYYYFQQHAVKYKPEPVDDVGAFLPTLPLWGVGFQIYKKKLN